MVKEQTNNIGNTSNVKQILKGSVIAIILSIILLFNFSAILTYTRVAEKTIPIVIIFITALSILVGSKIATSNVKSKGFINGGMVGLIYIVFLYLISSIITKKFDLNYFAIIMIAVSISSGCIGGIIGINRKK